MTHSDQTNNNVVNKKYINLKHIKTHQWIYGSGTKTLNYTIDLANQTRT